MTRRMTLLLAATLALSVLAADAATCTWTIMPPDVIFGTYTAVGPTLTAATDFEIRCSPPGSVTISLTAGSGGGAPYSPREMRKGPSRLTYDLYQDAANSIIWGDGTSGTQTFTWTPPANNSVLRKTIFGTLPTGSDVPVGAYKSTITITVNGGSGGTITDTFDARATVIAGCTVQTTPLGFGSYDPVGANTAAPRDAAASVMVYCTNGTPASVSLNLGSHATGATRRMLGTTGDFLDYEIYRDAGRTVIWNATNLNSGTSTSINTPIGGGFTAYGRIPAGRDVAVSAYNDAVVVTVNY